MYHPNVARSIWSPILRSPLPWTLLGSLSVTPSNIPKNLLKAWESFISEYFNCARWIVCTVWLGNKLRLSLRTSIIARVILQCWACQKNKTHCLSNNHNCGFQMIALYVDLSGSNYTTQNIDCYNTQENDCFCLGWR